MSFFWLFYAQKSRDCVFISSTITSGSLAPLSPLTTNNFTTARKDRKSAAAIIIAYRPSPIPAAQQMVNKKSLPFYVNFNFIQRKLIVPAYALEIASLLVQPRLNPRHTSIGANDLCAVRQGINGHLLSSFWSEHHISWQQRQLRFLYMNALLNFSNLVIKLFPLVQQLILFPVFRQMVLIFYFVQLSFCSFNVLHDFLNCWICNQVYRFRQNKKVAPQFIILLVGVLLCGNLELVLVVTRAQGFISINQKWFNSL